MAKAIVSRKLAFSVVLVGLLTLSSVAWESNAGAAACANSAHPGFRAYLADCRAYELVTPAYKEAQSAGSDGFSEEVGADGPRLLVRDFGSFSGVEGQTGVGALYELGRSASGDWQSSWFGVPFSTSPLFEVETMSPDFSKSLWLMRAPGKSETEDFYLHSSDGSLTSVGPAQPPTANERFAIFVGASEDLRHIFFQAFPPRVWPGDASGTPSLYEYEGTHNSEPRLVGVSNEGPVASIGEAHLISGCGTYLGSEDGDAYNAISQDGSTVFFTGAACGVQLPVNELFARVDNGRQDAHTVAVSEPSLADCGACDTSSPAEGQFRGASRDGSKVFFTTEQHLLPDGAGAGSALYEYDFNGPEHSRLTLLSSGDPSGGRVRGVARVSEDGSRVYFVAQGVLTGEANGLGDHAQDGANNLYLSVRECVGGGVGCVEPERRVVFVARLSEEDSEDWAGSDIRPVQATPDGRFLVFQSTADLTPDQEGREEAGQVFEYDSQTGVLTRASRGENGYNQDGNTNLYRAKIPIQGHHERDHPTARFGGLAISADGSYVFFTSEDGLTPQALTGSRNVYEYHEGKVTLISDGHDLSMVEESPGVELLGTDESGKDVFFATTEQLVPQDTDTQQDIYDARIDGGSSLPTVRTPCSGDSCQGAASSPLPLLGSGTSLIAPEASGAVSSPKVKVKPKPKVKSKLKAKKRARRKHKSRKHGAKKSVKARR